MGWDRLPAWFEGQGDSAGSTHLLCGRCVDALSNDRPYREAWPEEKVLEYLAGEAGKHFDPEVIQAFLKMRAGEA